MFEATVTTIAVRLMFAKAGVAIAYTKPSIYFDNSILNKYINPKRYLDDIQA
jgi:hypothetical protein